MVGILNKEEYVIFIPFFGIDGGNLQRFTNLPVKVTALLAIRFYLLLAHDFFILFLPQMPRQYHFAVPHLYY